MSGEDSETEDKFQTVTYQYNDGIKDYVDYLVKSRKATPVEPDVIDFEAEDLKIGISAEIAMQWTTAYSGSRAHLRQHHLHHRRRHP